MAEVPLFSLITIAYNDLNGLRRTVASVEAQEMDGYEHLIVDGGSDDGSVDYLKSLASDPRRSWTSELDYGIYDAMNKGIGRSHGQLVMMLNSGDSLADGHVLQKIGASYYRHQWEWSYGAVRLVNPDGCHAGSYSFDPFDMNRFIMGLKWIPHATVVMERRLVERLGSYRTDMGSAADQEMLMRALKSSPPAVIPEFLCHYETGGVSMQQGARSRELAWHRMRAENGYLMRGRAVDRAVSELLALGPPIRRALRARVGFPGSVAS